MKYKPSAELQSYKLSPHKIFLVTQGLQYGSDERAYFFRFVVDEATATVRTNRGMSAQARPGSAFGSAQGDETVAKRAAFTYEACDCRFQHHPSAMA